MPCLSREATEQEITHSQKLNHYLIEQASFHVNYQALACPITGIGIPTDQFTQLFYRAHFKDGLKTAKQFAEYIQNTLDPLGWLVLDNEGKSVQDRAESLKILQSKAQIFIDSDKLKIAKQLKLFA